MNKLKIFKEFGRNPQLDWITTLLLTAVLVVGLALNAYYLYNALQAGKIVAPGGGDTSFKKVDETLIESVIGKFDDRSVVSQSLEKGYASSTDPSI